MAKKYQEIYNKLHSDILSHVFRNGEKLPSEAQMIEIYGVSRQTVRRVLSMLEQDGLISKSQGSGSYVQYAQAVQTTKKIAAIFYDLDISVFPFTARRIDSILYQQGFSTAFYSVAGSDEKERTILKQLITSPVDGIIMFSGLSHPICNNMDIISELKKQGTKILFFESWYGNPEFRDVPIISCENYTGPYLITDFLIQQGHTRIGSFRILNSLTFASRFSGMYNALLCNGIEIDPKNFFNVVEEIDYQNIATAEQAEKLLALDAFICPNKWVLDSVVEALRQFGTGNLRTIVVFDDVPAPQIDGVEFIILQYDIDKLATLCAEKIMDLIKGVDVKSVQLPWKLCASSTAKTLPTTFEKE